MGCAKRRIGKIEEVLTGIDDIGKLREVKRDARFQYNLSSASQAALIASIRSVLGEIELPGWAGAELYGPIPPGADKQAASVSRLNSATVTDDKLIQMLGDVPADIGAATLREAQWKWQTMEAAESPSATRASIEAGELNMPMDYT